MASQAEFRHEHIARKPRGWRVRTVTAGEKHRARIAFPPGPRRRGAGRLLELLHPKGENPTCEVTPATAMGLAQSANPEELIIFGNPSKKYKVDGLTVSVGGNERLGFAGQAKLKSGWHLSPRFSSADQVLDYFRGKNPTRNKRERSSSARKRSPGRARAQRAKRSRSNPPAGRAGPDGTKQAVRLFQIFHGKDPKEILEKQRSAAIRKDYTALGKLDYIDVCVDGRSGRMNFEGDGVTLASSPDGSQLYLIGGNQNLNGCLEKFTEDTAKDLFDLGEAVEVQYLARKIHGDYEPVSYYHRFGEGGAARPRVVYDRLKRELFFAGGSYFIDTKVSISPGIEG